MRAHPILDGIRRLDPGSGLPGTALAVEKGGFALLGSPGEVVVAGIESGKGRVIAIGHSSFFTRESLPRADNRRFLIQALRWLGNGKNRIGRLGFGMDEAALREAGITFTSPADCDVLLLDQAALDSDLKRAEVLAGWVKAGGGLLVCGPLWGWMQLHPGKSPSKDCSGNRVLLPLGLALTDGTEETVVPIDAGRGDALAAFTALEAGRDGPGALALVEKALGILPESHSLARAIVRRAQSQPPVVPTKERPVGADQPLARLKARLERNHPTPGRAHPASAVFPGAVPRLAPRARRTLSLPAGVPGWHSTGLYAPPGQKITVTAAASGGESVSVRIGAHSDTLWHLEKWERFPEISREWPLLGGRAQIESPFGGSIFLVAPEGVSALTATIEGAVEAPFFVRGKTKDEEWSALRRAPGPWAELVGEKVALSVPSSVVRSLPHPEALVAYWDEVMAHCYALYAAPVRSRPERYCVDRQISAGYMHSGYPIMTWEDVAERFVDLAVLRGPDGDKTWGFYHEMGHNFQEPEWTWDGCGEVTNNLFSLYGGEKLNRVYDEKARTYPRTHKAVRPDALEKSVGGYLSSGSPFEKWKSDPWIALSTFIDLRKEFGWEPLTQVFAEYQSEKRKPRTTVERCDGFIIRFSRAVGKNIRPHFVRYGLPTSDEGCRPVKNLPDWSAR